MTAAWYTSHVAYGMIDQHMEQPTFLRPFSVERYAFSCSSARRCDALLGEGCVLGDKKLRLPTTFVTFCVSPGARRWPGKVEVMASFLSDGLCFGSLF